LDNGSGQTYQWDAENRLIKITYSDNSKTEFTYDGLSRRVRITERNASNTITGDKRYLWAGGNQPAEERNAAGTTVLKQYHPQGEFIPATSAPLNKLFYTKDHLGSVRELVDANGALQTRYDYDMWGKRVKLSGTIDSDVGYTGHHHHAKSGLVLTWYRAYDAEAGRWLSADPIGEEGGMNLYGYVGNSPINSVDPLGLWQITVSLAYIGGGQVTFGNNGGSTIFNGQWNGGLKVGGGAGLSISVDASDSGCREQGPWFAGNASGSIGGAGYGTNASYDYDGGKHEGTLSYGGRFGPFSSNTNWTFDDNNSTPTTPRQSAGLSNYGASVFAGFGVSYAGKKPSNGSCLP
jgi:RHS repeat-associated protein